MAVTVLAQVRARPGEGGSMLRGWRDLLTRYSPSMRYRRFGLVFRAMGASDDLLYVAEWADRAAFDARADEIDSRAWVREHAARVEVAFLEPLHIVERVLVPVHVAEVAQLRVPSAALDDVLELLRSEAAIGDDPARFAIRTLYRRTRDARRLLVYRGWSSRVGPDASWAGDGPSIDAELVGRGVAIERFCGSLRVADPSMDGPGGEPST